MPINPGFTAASYDLVLEQGDDWKPPAWYLVNADGTPIDLTGNTGHMQIRSDYGDATVQADLVNGVGVVFGDGGTVQLYMPKAASIAWAIDMARLKYRFGGRTAYQFGVYDLKATDADGLVRTLVGGAVYVIPRVTQ